MDTVGQETAGRLEWRVWPAGERPGLSVGVAALALGLSLGAMWSFGSGWYAFITLAVLALALAPHYFPTRYRLDEQTVSVQGPSRHVERPWEAFRVAVVQTDRVILSPLTKLDSWIARRRSVSLRFGDKKNEVLQFVQRHVPVQ